MSGTVLKALYQFMGMDVSDQTVCYKVLQLEQLMSTGGGWQDQAGGLIPGLKLIETDPGEQVLKIKKLNVSEETLQELNSRLFLINTAQRRLARNILRDVMGKYISGDEEVIRILREIKILARKMVQSLEKGEVDKFGRQLDKHWELSKKLDIGCTNTCIEFIFESIRELIDGRFICGAGGGGFLLVLLKRGITKGMLDQRIENVFQDIGIHSWAIKIIE